MRITRLVASVAALVLLAGAGGGEGDPLDDVSDDASADEEPADDDVPDDEEAPDDGGDAADAPVGDGAVEVFSSWTAGGEADALDALIEVFNTQYGDQYGFVNVAVAGGAGTNARAVLANRPSAGDPRSSWQGHAGQEQRTSDAPSEGGDDEHDADRGRTAGVRMRRW